MKSGLLQILYASPFSGLDPEDPYTQLTKFYKSSKTLRVDEEEEKDIFMWLFPHSFNDKTKEWYLDQLMQVMTNCNILEENFLNKFFPHNKFMETKTTIVMFYQ